MRSNRPRRRLQQQKANFLKRLGAESDEDLYEHVLKESFTGDAFEANIEGVFCNYYLQRGHACERFCDSFWSWGGEKLDEAFKLRRRVAGANTLALFGAFGLSFANPVAGIATGVAVSGAAGVAEGVAKRNVASFGHLQSHLSHKIHGCTTRMIEKSLKLDCLTPDARQRLRELEHPENKSKKSALARMASYFSGPIVSGVNNLVSRFSTISNLASGVIGTFIPFLPLATVGLSRIASNIRHKSAISEGKFLDDVADIIFDENSWTNKDRASGEIEKLTKGFAQELATSDNHGRIPSDGKKYHKAPAQSKDKNTNIKKGITFPAWLAAKAHKFVKRKLLKKNVEDIAEKPKSKVVFASESSEKLDKKSKEEAAALDEDHLQSRASVDYQSRPASKSKPESKPNVVTIQSGQKDEVDELLTEFSQLASKPVERNKTGRSQQVKKQNKVIDKVLSKSREFILKSQTTNHEDNTTIFVYAHPDFQDQDHPKYEERQVVYIRNNSSGKIDVLYGQKASAFVVERPTEEKNGLIVKIGNSVEYYGQTSGSIFQSFKSKSSPGTSLGSAKSQNVIGSREIVNSV